MDLITGTAAQHNVRAWVDWDNSGSFTSNELVLSANQVFSASSATLVPAFAFLNAPLRIRVMANFYLLAPPDPCTDIQSGQAEDYCVVVIPNPNPPTALFSATPTFTCDGAVQFTDGSLNTPTSWQWDFGDLGAIDNSQSPLHTYTASGIYTVTLIVTNANGADTLVQNALITVDLNNQLVPAACTPQTQGYCCGYGILGVQFAGINSTSPDGVERMGCGSDGNGNRDGALRD